MTAVQIAADVRLPPGRGGWWHRYVCPAHGVELAPGDLLSGQFPAGGAACVHGCRINSPEVREAWAVLAHQACARHIRDLARCADPRGQDLARSLLDEYAHRYAAAAAPHDGADPWMLRGRLFHQALTEAIWAVPIAQASWELDHQPQLRQQLATAMDAARQELAAQGRLRSNYTAWLLAAATVCTRDPQRLPALYAHVRDAILPDGWEWEASTYYHGLVLRAYLLALQAVPDADVPADVTARLAAMARVLHVLCGPDGRLPALHDGPYARPAYDIELADLADLLAQAMPGWAATPVDPVTVFPDAGYAVLRLDGLTAIADFGPHGGSHGHRDKLALYLYGDESPWQPDPGQVPYGHPVWRDYYASTRAHPTFTVDGAEQAACAGRLVHSDATSVVIACDDAYPGVRARRTLRIDGGALHDELTVTADRACTITSQLRPAVPLTVHVDADGLIRTRWSGATILRGEHRADVPALPVVRPGPGPADDPQQTWSHLDWTATTSVTFCSTYRLGE